MNPIASELSHKPKPFLRWAGGKNWLQKHLEPFIPLEFDSYYEPFLGGASTYLNVAATSPSSKKYFLSDENASLINAYNVIKNNVDRLIDELSGYENEKSFYYKQREIFYEDEIKQAANFIFLNRTSFNGIYRVNRRGKYNVPYGNKKYKNLFDFDNLKSLSLLFQTASFVADDFCHLQTKIKKNDLIFLDPPYTVAHENNGFVAYNEKIFSWNDQERLADLCVQIDRSKAYFILTNAAHKSIKELFSSRGSIYEFFRPCVIGGSKAKRDLYKEYVITNVR